MNAPANDDAQRELEQRALRNVRNLVDKLEQTDEIDNRSQKKLVVGMLVVLGVVVLAGAFGIASIMSEKPPPQTVDVSKLPPVKVGNPRY